MKIKIICQFAVMLALVLTGINNHYPLEPVFSPPESVNNTINKLTNANNPNSDALTKDGAKRLVNTDKEDKLIGDSIHTPTGQKYPLRTYKPLMAPNDPNATQWWTTASGLNSMWDTPRGNNNTLLAIIDTGFALNHEEFQNRWYTNLGESGSSGSEQPSLLNCSDRGAPLSANCNLIDDDYDGEVDNESGLANYQNPSRRNCTDQGKPLDRSCNRIDDDGNGLVDDVNGWDFINYDNSTQAGELNPSGAGTRHGTFVAGAAAATGNNNKGIAGADWGTTILPIQAINDDSYGHTLSVARSIRYAAAQGADIISLSLGSQEPDDMVRLAVQDAIAAGSVVVAASGNNGCNCMVYPANYPEVVAVGAQNTDGQPASFSSWGANLDVLAPGVGLYTTDWQASNQTGAYASGIGGTSLATPIVSGTLTRLLSHRPDISALQLIALLHENLNRLSLPSNTSRSDVLGFGSLNAAAATARMLTPKNYTQTHSLVPVSSGNQFDPAAEYRQSSHAYQCQDIPGTTPLIELNSPSHNFYTTSYSEAAQANRLGYTSRLFAYTCLQLPHDRPQTMRSIDIRREFYNLAKP